MPPTKNMCYRMTSALPGFTRLPAPSHRGMTLTELLVVIAVLIILAALLLPALSGARSKANQTKCLNKLRQIQLACISYAGENNGEFPPDPRAFALPHEFVNFSSTLGRYLKEPRSSAMFCPGELSRVRNSNTALYQDNYTTYQYFNYPIPFQGTFSTGKPDLSRIVTAPVTVALWGCLTVKRTDNSALAHAEPAVKKPISGMNAVYPDGHAQWVQLADLEAYYKHTDGSLYYWPKPPNQNP